MNAAVGQRRHAEMTRRDDTQRWDSTARASMFKMTRVLTRVEFTLGDNNR